MTKQEKLKTIQEKDYNLFVKTRREVFDELDKQYSMFCCCGRLATGLHMRNCKKFNDKVTSATIKRLEHLWKNS